jgi:hypothetical protein
MEAAKVVTPVESSPEDMTMEVSVGSDNDVVNETPEVGQA